MVDADLKPFDPGCVMHKQGGSGSQAQVLISTQPGASNDDVQSVVGTLATAASSGQLLYDLKAAGARSCSPHQASE